MHSAALLTPGGLHLDVARDGASFRPDAIQIDDEAIAVIDRHVTGRAGAHGWTTYVCTGLKVDHMVQ